MANMERGREREREKKPERNKVEHIWRPQNDELARTDCNCGNTVQVIPRQNDTKSITFSQACGLQHTCIVFTLTPTYPTFTGDPCSLIYIISS